MRKSGRSVLLGATALFTGAVWAGGGAAQTQPAEVEELVVTGQRAAERAAIETKRATFNISDGVNADDIASLPDHNTAAALRRIPGVAVQEDQGEPRFPVIRGLNSTYNRTTVDGAIVASVDEASRSVPLDIVPATLASRLEVVKAVTPDMDANAIGGVINIVTRSPFDATDRYFAATVAGAEYEYSGDVRGEEFPFRASFTASDRFGAEGNFGVIVSASFQKRDSDIPQIEIANPSFREYTAAGLPVNSGSPLGNGVQVPVQRRLFWYNNIRERAGGQVAAEWRPSAALRLRASGLYTEIKDDEERIESRYEQIASAPVRDQTPTSGRFEQGQNIIQLNLPQINRSIWGATLGADWSPSDTVEVSADLVYSGAELDQPQRSEEFRTPTARSREFGFAYDTSGFFPRFNALNPALLADPANYVFQTRNDQVRNSQEDVYEARTDVVLRGLEDRGLAFKFGGVLRSTERSFDQDSTTYALRPGFNYALAQVVEPGPSPTIQDDYRIDLRIGAAASLAFFEANRDRFNPTVNNVTGDFEVTEDVQAAYGQVTWERGPVTLIGGLRYERTEVDSSSVRTVGSTVTPSDASGEYDNWLPGVHLRWELAEDIVLRAAWTNTIGRPNFGDITAREAITTTSSQPTLSRGNPALKPRESEAFDVSVEFYIPDGLFAVGLFSKDIKNEIFSLTTLERLDLGLGQGLQTVEVTQPQNAQDASIVGLEAAFQQALTFLPAPFDGLGVNANVTLLDTRFTVATPVGLREPGFFLQPDLTSNASVYYQQGPFEARLSYNYLDGFLETINANIPNADQFWDKRETYDAQVSYRLGERFTVFAEVENLNNAGRRELTGPDRNLLQESAEYGRTYWLGVSASF